MKRMVLVAVTLASLAGVGSGLSAETECPGGAKVSVLAECGSC